MIGLPKSGGASPVKSSGNRSVNGTPTPKVSTPSVSSNKNKSSGPVVFKVNLSQLSPTKQQVQQHKPNKRDLAILHESRIFKTLVANAAKKKEEVNKRDPILQNNSEETHKFKPSVKRLASADKLSACLNETFIRSKKAGEYNYHYNPPPTNPKPEGIKPFRHVPSESSDENPRRQLREARSKSELRRNPLIDGDIDSEIIRRSKKSPEQNDHHQRLNDRKYLLPAERGRSALGRVFRDTTFTVVGTDYSLLDESKDRIPTLPPRPMTAMEEKVRGNIKGVLEYEDGPSYRDQGVSHKCTTIKFSDILKNLPSDNDKVFLRKKTLDY